jgi:hypothetical protein
MTTSTSDILTTLKNIPTALNGLGNAATNAYNLQPTTQLAFTPVGTGITTLYTASAQIASHVNCINICNTTASTITVSIFNVASGELYSANNAIFYNAPISANTTVLWEGVIIMAPNSSLQSLASASGATINVSGGTL